MINTVTVKDEHYPDDAEDQPVVVLFASGLARRDFGPVVVDAFPEVPHFIYEWRNFCNRTDPEVWGKVAQVGVFEGRQMNVNGITFMKGTFRHLTAEEAATLHLPLREWHRFRPVTWLSVAQLFILKIMGPGRRVWFESAEGVLRDEARNGDRIFLGTGGWVYRIEVGDGCGSITSVEGYYCREFARHSDLEVILREVDSRPWPD